MRLFGLMLNCSGFATGISFRVQLEKVDVRQIIQTMMSWVNVEHASQILIQRLTADPKVASDGGLLLGYVEDTWKMFQWVTAYEISKKVVAVAHLKVT